MLSNRLLIGQYYPTGSPLHALDARSKIIASLLYMITLFVVSGWPAYFALTLVFALTLAISRIPFPA
ncbi:MAG: energy-coupling factor transporter transmembrane protein EcfT, partial [Clostridiales bacterium]|nr:energy-coupling factor transporter transmembrane protein EcfT [Clostridiales bacterium]